MPERDAMSDLRDELFDDDDDFELPDLLPALSSEISFQKEQVPGTTLLK